MVFMFFLLGLIFGSFVNALVWRLRHRQLAKEGKGNKKLANKLFKANSRSMCPNCEHTLSALDLIPVLSWCALRGRCKYCKKPISIQYPLVELATAAIFSLLYLCWPNQLQGVQWALLVLWLVASVIFMAMALYDFKWMLLPDELMAPLLIVAIAVAGLTIASSINPAHAAFNTFLAVMVGGSIFFVIFQLSGGKMIGGGDVKLGWILGLMLGTAVNAMLMLFLAGLGGSLVALTLLLSGKLRRNSLIPFGPFLILGALIVVLFGNDISSWYQNTFLLVN
jgi:prepilin signal peptidase PulO-like enzyme (type II secretory pathway)